MWKSCKEKIMRKENEKKCQKETKQKWNMCVMGFCFSSYFHSFFTLFLFCECMLLLPPPPPLTLLLLLLSRLLLLFDDDFHVTLRSKYRIFLRKLNAIFLLNSVSSLSFFVAPLLNVRVLVSKHLHTHNSRFEYCFVWISFDFNYN